MAHPTRILIAPTSFKGSLSAHDAARIIETALLDAASSGGVSIETERCPIGDGGEGTASILAGAIGASPQRGTVPSALGDQSIEAEWFRLDRLSEAPALSGALGLDASDGPLGIFDAAEVGGLPRVPIERRDPARVSTVGIGALIEAARAAGCATVVVGLGGSASIDAGIGAASAFGWRFLDTSGAVLAPVGGSLGQIARMTRPAPGSAPAPRIIALCDVTNPLLGPEGAARTFGPQKGATPEQVEALDAAMAMLTKRCILSMIPANPGAPGSGAAGGLGFGLATFLGGELRPGAPTILDALSFDERLARADLVVTGEGSLDAQTSHGKAIGALLERARAKGVPVAAIAGRAEAGVGGVLGLAGLATLVDDSTPPERAMAESERLLGERAGALWRSLHGG